MHLRSLHVAPCAQARTSLTLAQGIHLIKHAAWRTVERGGQFVLLGSAPDPKVQVRPDARFHLGYTVMFVLGQARGCGTLLHAGVCGCSPVEDSFCIMDHHALCRRSSTR